MDLAFMEKILSILSIDFCKMEWQKMAIHIALNVLEATTQNTEPISCNGKYLSSKWR
jgi:hypothetical protein